MSDILDKLRARAWFFNNSLRVQAVDEIYYLRTAMVNYREIIESHSRTIAKRDARIAELIEVNTLLIKRASERQERIIKARKILNGE